MRGDISANQNITDAMNVPIIKLPEVQGYYFHTTLMDNELYARINGGDIVYYPDYLYK